MAIFSSIQAATNAVLENKHTFTVEENNSLKPAFVNALKRDEVLFGMVESFENEIKLITVKTELETKAIQSGLAIFNHAVIKNKSIRDDRPLYWARNKMMYLLKELMNSVPALSDESILKQFESKSRGFNDVNFTGIATGTKKIIITGFDPFQIKENTEIPTTGNPSGVCALFLHNQELTFGTVTAKIQTAILPTRFADFNAGVVERFYNKYIDSSQEPVDMIITISQGRPSRYDLERFAAKYREPSFTDNLLNKGGTPIYYVPSGTDLAVASESDNLLEFYETTLPSDKIVPGSDSNPYTIFNQMWRTGFISGGIFVPYILNIIPPNFRDLSNHFEPNLPNLPNPPIGNLSYEGSGGNFMSNESFYRVSVLREKHASLIKSGHLHVPLLENITDEDDFNDKNTKLANDVRNMIIDAISVFI